MRAALSYARAPVTVLGRGIAVGLMIGGIVILGVVTATVLSSLSDRILSRVDPAAEEPGDA